MISPIRAPTASTQVRLFEPRDEAGARAGAEIADKAGEPVVDDVLAAERAAHRQIVGLGKPGDVAAGSRRSSRRRRPA